MQDLDKLLDEEINFWNPKEGEKLIGDYHGVREGVGKFGSNVYLIKKEDGEVLGVWGSKVIDDKLKDTTIGTRVGIKFLGMAKGEVGNYRNYRVIVVDNEDAPVQKDLKGGKVEA